MSDSDLSHSESKADGKPSLPEPTDLKEALRSISPESLKSIPPEVLEKLKGTKAILIREQHTRTEFSVTHCGPLPSPSYLAQYNEIIPQGADRIMKQSENQSAHRIEVEKHVITGQGKRESNGQWFGFIIALVGITCGTYAIICGHPVAGATVCGSPPVGLVSVFVFARAQGAADLKRKKSQIDAMSSEMRSQSQKNQRNKKRKE